MPIPKPNMGESDKDYHSRCMGNTAMQEYDSDQRNAICYQTYRDKDKVKGTEVLDEDSTKEILATAKQALAEANRLLSEVKNGLVRIALAYTGDFEKDGKPFRITMDDLRSMQKHLKKREVSLDYEHLSARADSPPGHTRASGWLKSPDTIESFKDGSKILWGWAEFTPAALAAIRQKEYRYFSPEIHWKDDDEQGNPIGTRLAAGAVTNRPFLKDLPPIEIAANDYPQLLEAVALSEHQRLVSVDGVHVPADINTKSKEGDKMKKFKMKKLVKGDDKGKHGIFDGDEQVGVLEADELTACDLAELTGRKLIEASEFSELQELRKLKATYDEAMKGNEKMAESLAELTTLRASAKKMEQELTSLRALNARMAKGGDLFIKHEDDEDDAQAGLTELVREHKARTKEVAILTEFAKAKPGEETMILAEAKLGSGELSMAAYIRSQKIERLVDGAIKEGKVLPKNREAIYRLAIADFESTSQYLKEARPVLDLKTHGISGRNESESAKVELDQQVKQYMTDHKSTYAEALKEVTRKNPELWRRHQTESAILVDSTTER